VSEYENPRHLALVCHPDTPARAVRAIAVEVDLSFEEGFALRFIVEGEIGAIVLPQGEGELVIADSVTDGLWQSTCFEAFLTEEGQPDYTEFNYAPDGRWACYQFDAAPRFAGELDSGARARGRPLCLACRARYLSGHRIEAGAVGGDRGNRRDEELLGAPSSAGQARLPSSRLLCADA
jgi:hypothetical protein